MHSAHAIVDRELLDGARSGDRDALAELWRTYQPQLLRFLRSCGSRSPEDVASQVWIEVGRSLTRFDGDGRAFQRWLFTIARRRDIDEIRRGRRRRESVRPETDLAALAASDDPVADAFPLDTAIALVSTLPRQMAEAIMLRVVHDLDVSAAAEIMEVSESNVRVLVHRGLTRLRARITEARPPSGSARATPAPVRIAAASSTDVGKKM